MGRWEPNAKGRLAQAAFELFQERGYGQTTVEEIAARAGLTERTFFRHFTDKREVLFLGAAALQKSIADTIAAAPAATAPLDAVAAALEAAAALLPLQREHARARRNLIVAHAELKEREQMKLTSLTDAAAAALRGRGVAEPAATLTAEAGIVIFKVAFERWLDDTQPGDVAQHIRASLDELKAVVAGTSTASISAPPHKLSLRKPPRSRRTAK